MVTSDSDSEQGPREPDNSDQVNRRLDELTDLFRRRLLDDREKSRAIGILQSELEQAREGVRRQSIEPILRQLILILDRIDGHTPDDGEGSPFLGSVRDELLEILNQYGVTRLDHFDQFNPTLAESVGTHNTGDQALDGTVAKVERPAYLWSGLIMRPAAVSVWQAQS